MKKFGKKQKIFAIFGLLVFLGTIYFTYNHLFYVSTDNAQVAAHVVMLSSRVNGTIEKVFVEENQKVKSGTVLAQIDTSDYSSARQAARAGVESLEARAKEAELSLSRARDLLREQAIPRDEYDRAEATYKEASGKLQQAKAQSDQADLNVSYTRLVAASDGIIARKSVEPGQFVVAGQPLLGFVSTAERWVNANLKETELPHIHIGQNVTIHVDALPGRSFEGKIVSISPSTGAAFSLLPPDNATGNFTKVVQRVPVRIQFSNLAPEDSDLLRAGLSAEISVKVL